MKKYIIIFSILIAILSISAFTYKKWNKTYTVDSKSEKPQNTVFFNKYLFTTLDNTIYYNVESRFNVTISKDKLSNHKSFFDTFSKMADESSENATFASISKLNDDMLPIKSIESKSTILNEPQIKLLKSLDYQDNVLIKLAITKKNPNTDKMATRLLTYYLTVVPEKVAEFSLGKKAFIDFIRENTQTETLNVNKNKVGTGRISFMVLENGEISDIKLENKSNIKVLDDKLIKLLNNLPSKWSPARNALGEPVAQELILFFGNQGC